MSARLSTVANVRLEMPLCAAHPQHVERLRARTSWIRLQADDELGLPGRRFRTACVSRLSGKCLSHEIMMNYDIPEFFVVPCARN